MAENINAPPDTKTPAEAVTAARAGEDTSDNQTTEHYTSGNKQATLIRVYNVNRWLLVGQCA